MRETITAAAQCCEKVVKDPIYAETFDAARKLGSLRDIPMTLRVLRETGIGRTVRKAVNASGNQFFSSTGMAILESWRPLLAPSDKGAQPQRASAAIAAASTP